jgi:hypothetical protein
MAKAYDENDVAVKEVKKDITRKRVEIKETKETVEAMGEEVEAVVPPDLESMYAGKLCNILVKAEVSAGNIISGYERKYPSMPPELKEKLLAEKDMFLDKFKSAKDSLSKIVEKHPLWERLKGIKGFSPYQLGLLISYIKDIKRFENFSQLSVYSGLASITDVETKKSYPITKGNINIIKEIYAKRGKEFKGFNTEMSGRMFVVTECLIRSQGFFYRQMLQMRERLEAKAINDGRCEKIGEGETAKWYMKGKNKQSLISWSLSNAKRRIATMLLYFVWEQWKMVENIPIRDLYVMEILSHKTKVTLAEVLKADSVKILRPRKKKDQEGATDESNTVAE